MDNVVLLTAIFATIAVLVFLFLYLKNASRGNPEGRTRARAAAVDREDTGGVRRVVRNRGARNRMRGGGADDDEEVGAREQQVRELLEENDIEMPSGKIGTKKLRKLEEKAEKRRLRELELQEREERKQKQADEDERRKKEDQKRDEEEKRQEELERKAKEDAERREHEEYLRMKAAFDIEEEGFDQEEDSPGRLTEFIKYIDEQKVVQLEDLAARFKLKTQDCIDRLHRMIEEESICGVIDDRGKFISITKAELEEVAKFIKLRGRVSIQELVENSNRLINLSVSV
ncbi:DDRGK domain-containing protein 1 [Galendromus occidentalis]|uniref:DDRGK domain-containing protein 1 n=1 Tax=Galendromus occidentalis TaxID=34638 RepID=A0AAJ7L4M5_9ACAR|nr:DDRGK domain-containing protein 1 [Galendromus occidentalis]